MKTQISLLGSLVLAWNIALANVDCAKAPYGESVARYGRDEFQLGILAMTHKDNYSSVPRAMIQSVDKEMRAACLARFYGEDLPRYAALGLPPKVLATESVGSIAAVALSWDRPHHRGGGTVPPRSSTAGVTVPTERRSASGEIHDVASPAHIHYMKVTSNFPACPRRADLKRLLAAALIDKAAWPQAEAAGKMHGCIELHAGERVYRVRADLWGGVSQVRPEGRTTTYWTDARVVK